MQKYKNMLRNKTVALIIVLIFCAFSAFSAAAQEQSSERPDPAEMAAKEAERLENALKLEYWQVFYVDSILCHNYTEWMAEIESLQKARVENNDLYTSIQDKWMERCEQALKKVFTEKQWKEYLKSGAERYIRDREKRREKANEATQATDTYGKKAKKQKK